MDALKILKNNKDVPFVKRVLNPEIPALKIQGKNVTHRMSAEIDETDGKAYAFPTVVIENGQYRIFDDNFKALEWNKRRGNVIQFESITEALKFSQNYKPDSFKEFYGD